MNAVRSTRTPSSQPARAASPRAAASQVRSVRRERDFGIGYGSSSGYGSNDRPYAASGAQAYFRCR
ncbi:MAG TPA: hypothetical protein VJ806_16660 [Luteimonas sp.]|nr:hypothetical protein [Luteimonas sp.]